MQSDTRLSATITDGKGSKMMWNGLQLQNGIVRPGWGQSGVTWPVKFETLFGRVGHQTCFVVWLWSPRMFWIYILLTSSKNQIYEFRIPNIYNSFFNNIRLMYTLCFLVASVKLKVYKKVVKFSFKQQKILGIRNS